MPPFCTMFLYCFVSMTQGDIKFQKPRKQVIFANWSQNGAWMKHTWANLIWHIMAQTLWLTMVMHQSDKFFWEFPKVPKILDFAKLWVPQLCMFIILTCKLLLKSFQRQSFDPWKDLKKYCMTCSIWSIFLGF